MLFGRQFFKTILVCSAVSTAFLTKADASIDTVQFSTSPVLFPTFDSSVADYVVRTTGTTAVQVTVTNSDLSDTTTAVSVDDQPPISGGFTTHVILDPGQGF